MLALRFAIYALAGRHYRWDVGDVPYEYRKDVLAYLVLALIFQRFMRRPVQAGAPAAAPAHFDITDGARVTRAKLETIMAIRSAGNYAEFHLADGQARLMRVTLRTLEAELGAHGFERTHRSWLVNARAVLELRPAGSGDFTLTLAGGVTAPLSRRFPKALARLRGGTVG
jgi:DNA-binding LytR/AlgR family response regulator